jgi:hypothetical protein
MWPGQRIPLRAKMRAWSVRNEKRLIALNICCLFLLCFAYFATLVIALYPAELLTLMHVLILVSAALILLSLGLKGPIPLVISVIGVVLIYNAVISPFYAAPGENQVILGRQRVLPASAPEPVQIDRPMHFSLGAGMVVFATIVAHRPSVLFTRNRPAPMDDEWSNYPVWRHNAILAGGRNEEVMPVKDMMTEKDLHLLWRYEYVLASVFGSIHLIKPDGLVPRDSTILLREKASGSLLGKPRFTGFFI